MNKLRRSWGCFVAIACTTATALYAQAQLDTGWSVGGGGLMRGQSLDTTRYFQAGNDYVIVADGDGNARDVDLLILNSRGRVVAKDDGFSKRALVRFKPSVSGTYTIRLQMADASGRALGLFMVFRNDGSGWYVPQRNIDAAVRRMAELTVLADLVGYRVERFYGRVMRPGERQEMAFSDLSLANYSITAVGDDFAHDLDLFVYRDGRLLDHDDEIDAVPVTVFRTSGQVKAVVDHASGSGPALVLVALHVKDTPYLQGGFEL